MSPYAAYLHDAVLLYALSVKEMLKEGKDIRDGKALVTILKGYNKTRLYGKLLGKVSQSYVNDLSNEKIH